MKDEKIKLSENQEGRANALYKSVLSFLKFIIVRCYYSCDETANISQVQNKVSSKPLFVVSQKAYG